MSVEKRLVDLERGAINHSTRLNNRCIEHDEVAARVAEQIGELADTVEMLDIDCAAGELGARMIGRVDLLDASLASFREQHERDFGLLTDKRCRLDERVEKLENRAAAMDKHYHNCYSNNTTGNPHMRQTEAVRPADGLLQKAESHDPDGSSGIMRAMVEAEDMHESPEVEQFLDEMGKGMVEDTPNFGDAQRDEIFNTDGSSGVVGRTVLQASDRDVQLQKLVDEYCKMWDFGTVLKWENLPRVHQDEIQRALLFPHIFTGPDATCKDGDIVVCDGWPTKWRSAMCPETLTRWCSRGTSPEDMV